MNSVPTCIPCLDGPHAGQVHTVAPRLYLPRRLAFEPNLYIPSMPLPTAKTIVEDIYEPEFVLYTSGPLRGAEVMVYRYKGDAP